MTFDRTGIILYVLKYDECVDFYKNIIGLKVLFKSETLTCFKFGDAYLMIEVDDENEPMSDSILFRPKTCLRMNIPDVKKYADRISQMGIKVNYTEFDWGTVAKFYDPDGNLCAFKDSKTFEGQIDEFTQ